MGEHWVTPHLMHVPVSETNPDGITTRHTGCRKNPVRGWSKYWNEVFQPAVPLDPDLVKALIASESGFNPTPAEQDAGVAGKARGLIQLTDQAIKALQDVDGELRNHLVEMLRADASDPNIAICAGIRWLFHKQYLATHRLGREATWMEGIAEYKAYLKDMVSGKTTDPDGMSNINRWYRELKK